MHHTISLTGPGFTLVPLSLAHAEGLFAFVDRTMWQGMAAKMPASVCGMEAMILDYLDDPAVLPFAIIHAPTGAIAGTTSFYDFVPEQARVEIGRTFLGQQFWGFGLNTSSKRAMLDYAFSTLKVHRVAFRCDMRNTRSVAVYTKLGAALEGVLRGYRMGHDGVRVDTGVFSILRDEWTLNVPTAELEQHFDLAG